MAECGCPGPCWIHGYIRERIENLFQRVLLVEEEYQQELDEYEAVMGEEARKTLEEEHLGRRH